MARFDAPFTQESLSAAKQDHADGGRCDLAGAVQRGADPEEQGKDFFKVHDGIRYAGTHLIIDLWGCRSIDDLALVEQALRDCVTAAGAALLGIHLHHFTENNGVSGVAILAESHISIHTWPEVGYAALDVFLCGSADPHETVPVLERAFAPREVAVKEILRGQEL